VGKVTKNIVQGFRVENITGCLEDHSYPATAIQLTILEDQLLTRRVDLEKVAENTALTFNSTWELYSRQNVIIDYNFFNPNTKNQN
jgi:hypothetical protein